MPKKTNPYLLFDLDGTLINSLPTLYQSYCNFLEHFGVNGSQSEFDELNGPSLKEVLAILIERYNLPIEHKQAFEKYIDVLKKSYQSQIQEMPHATHTLKNLKDKNIPMSLVTSNSLSLTQIIVEKLNWENFFDFLVTGDEVEQSKPNPDIYLKAISKGNLSPEFTIVIEDSKNGILASNASGLKTIYYNPNQNSFNLPVFNEINDLTQLEDALNGL